VRCRATVKVIRTIATITCTLATAGLAVCLAIERQARLKLAGENNALRQQLNQNDEVVADNRRLSDLLAQASVLQSRPSESAKGAAATDERVKELVRLRSEVEALRRQSKEIAALQADTRQIRAARENALKTQKAGSAGTPSTGTTTNGSQLEILNAEYWTPNTNMDVAAELRDRIRGDGLKAIASNNIKGDPEFGQVKKLTIVYRFGGVIRTNQFRENDLVILPAE
jgi:hypothetical protein